jgi:hypothetical protein
MPVHTQNPSKYDDAIDTESQNVNSPEQEAQEEQNKNYVEDSGAEVLNYAIQFGLAVIMLRLFQREKVIDAFKDFKNQEFASDLKILDEAGNIEKYQEAKKKIDKEIESRFSDRKLKSDLKSKKITDEQYWDEIKKRFKGVEKIKVGTGKGKFGEELSYDDYERRSQALFEAEKVHDRVSKIAQENRPSLTVSHFGMSEGEKKGFDNQFAEWKKKNKNGSFDDFIDTKGIDYIRNNTTYGKSKGRKFKKDEELGAFYQKSQSDAARSLSVAWGDGTAKQLSQNVDRLLDPNKPLITDTVSESINSNQTSTTNQSTSILNEEQQLLKTLREKGFSDDAFGLLTQTEAASLDKISNPRINTQDISKQETATPSVITPTSSLDHGLKPSSSPKPPPAPSVPKLSPTSNWINRLRKIFSKQKTLSGRITSTPGATYISKALNGLTDGLKSMFKGLGGLMGGAGKGGSGSAAASAAKTLMNITPHGRAIQLAVIGLIALFSVIAVIVVFVIMSSGNGLIPIGNKNALQLKPENSNKASWNTFYEKNLALESNKTIDKNLSWKDFENNYLTINNNYVTQNSFNKISNIFSVISLTFNSPETDNIK